MCLAYARAGVSGICISSRTASDLETLTDELLKINPKLNILSRTCDTTNAADVQSLVEVAKTTFDQRIDVVIANAGIISKYLYDTDTTTGEKSNRRLPKGIIEDDDFGRVIDINLMGSYNIAKYFTPVLLSSTNTSQVRAYIVITSLASHLTESHFTPVAYNVSKVGVNRMVEHMQNDHGKQGLQAFAVHPGAVLTPQTELHSTTKGDAWDALLLDDIGLCGGFLTWLTKDRREWLGGRYLNVGWDVDELEKKKDEIVREDKLKFRMVI
jgi:NAD(P)-dependent dehydrogenase (short-subunit alcohol dehydrogenase family)